MPKVICIFSPYQFYDKYVNIIEKLIFDIQGVGEHDGLPNLFEALIFEIVCKIETPVYKPVNYRGIKITNTTTNFNMPYISDSFFNTLFEEVKDVNTIITIFTHLLCEEKIILIARDHKTLIPVWLALHSLIYPFRM